MQQVRRWIVARWRLLMVLLTPLVLLPLPVIETSTVCHELVRERVLLSMLVVLASTMWLRRTDSHHLLGLRSHTSARYVATPTGAISDGDVVLACSSSCCFLFHTGRCLDGKRSGTGVLQRDHLAVLRQFVVGLCDRVG